MELSAWKASMMKSLNDLDWYSGRSMYLEALSDIICVARTGAVAIWCIWELDDESARIFWVWWLPGEYLKTLLPRFGRLCIATEFSGNSHIFCGNTAGAPGHCSCYSSAIQFNFHMFRLYGHWYNDMTMCRCSNESINDLSGLAVHRTWEHPEEHIMMVINWIKQYRVRP